MNETNVFYFSFMSTFDSYMKGSIKDEDLKNPASYFLFNWERKNFFTNPKTGVPCRLTIYNEKLNKIWHLPMRPNFAKVDQVEKNIYDKWINFQQIIKEKDGEDKVYWNHLEVLNYMSLTRQYIRAGHKVFWLDELQNLDHLSYLDETKEK